MSTPLATASRRASRILLNFCRWGGSSRGTRDFVYGFGFGSDCEPKPNRNKTNLTDNKTNETNLTDNKTNETNERNERNERNEMSDHINTNNDHVGRDVSGSSNKLISVALRHPDVQFVAQSIKGNKHPHLIIEYANGQKSTWPLRGCAADEVERVLGRVLGRVARRYSNFKRWHKPRGVNRSLQGPWDPEANYQTQQHK